MKRVISSLFLDTEELVDSLSFKFFSSLIIILSTIKPPSWFLTSFLDELYLFSVKLLSSKPSFKLSAKIWLASVAVLSDIDMDGALMISSSFTSLLNSCFYLCPNWTKNEASPKGESIFMSFVMSMIYERWTSVKAFSPFFFFSED